MVWRGSVLHDRRLPRRKRQDYPLLAEKTRKAGTGLSAKANEAKGMGGSMMDDRVMIFLTGRVGYIDPEEIGGRRRTPEYFSIWVNGETQYRVSPSNKSVIHQLQEGQRVAVRGVPESTLDEDYFLSIRDAQVRVLNGVAV